MLEARAAPPAPKGPDRSIRVLLVVGDKALANTVDLTLRHGSYLRRVAGNLDEAKSAIADWRPHLLVVDIDIESGRAARKRSPSSAWRRGRSPPCASGARKSRRSRRRAMADALPSASTVPSERRQGVF